MVVRFLDEQPTRTVRFLDETPAQQQKQPKSLAERIARSLAENIRPPQEVIPEFVSGAIQGGKELVAGGLQAGADIIAPESELRQLLPEAVQRSRQQFEARKTGTLPERAGEVFGESAPLALLPAGAATLPARIGLGALGGAVAGGTGATTEQLTQEEALKQRAANAAIGGTVGAVIPAAISGIAGVAKGATRLVKGRDADKILASKINATDATIALKELESGKISVLADVAGDEVRGLTRAVAKEKGGARQLVSDALEGRSKTAVNRVSNELSKSISNVDSYFGNLDDIAKARSSVASPLYVKAYSEATTIDKGNINKLLQDQRIITAINDAKTNLGVRIEAPSNSLEALDGAKKSLDDIIGTALRAGQNQRAASFGKLKNQLVKELDVASPTYKKARRIFSDFKSLEDAQEVGLKFSTQTPEQLKRTLSVMDNTQKEAFKIGVRANLQKTVGATADGADPAKRIFGNTQKRNQLQEIFGEGKQFDKFKRLMEEEIRAAETKFKVLGGSRTDFNITDDQSFIVAAAEQAARTGVKTTAIEAIAGAAKRRFVGLNPKSAKDLARILTDKSAGEAALRKLITDAPKSQKSIVGQAVNELGSALGIVTATEVR